MTKEQQQKLEEYFRQVSKTEEDRLIFEEQDEVMLAANIYKESILYRY